MFSNRSKLPKNISYKDIANINEEQFLFCFNFPKFEYEFCCGCSLKLGSIFLSFIFLLFSIFSLINVLKTQEKNNFDFFSSILLLIIYSISFLLILISSFNYNYIFSFYAYLIYSFMLILNFSEILITTIFIFCGIYVPYGQENIFIKGISFLLIGLLYIGVYLYCLWILFCYVIHLKYKRIDLVNGNFDKENYNNHNNNSRLREEEEYKLLEK